MQERLVSQVFYVAEQNSIMATLPEFDECAMYSGPVVLRLDTEEIEAQQVAHGNINGHPVVRLVPTVRGAKVLATLNNRPSATLVYPF